MASIFQLLLSSLFLSSVLAQQAKYALRLNHLQLAGSRNSYHLRPYPSLPQWEYNQELLESQLKQGIYVLEFDFFYVGGEFVTAQHLMFDANTTCATLYDCLSDIKTWFSVQEAKPILWIALGNKERWNDEQWTEMDNVVREVFPSDDLFTPDMIRGNYDGVQQAIFAKGWPTVREMSGKIIILLDELETSEYYTGKHSRLEGRLAFPYFSWTDRNNSNAVFLRIDTPSDIIVDAVKLGYIVRTRADSYLPNSPVVNQLQIDRSYFDVIDLDDDNLLNATELINFHYYATPYGDFVNSSALVTKVLDICVPNRTTVSWPSEFYCVQGNTPYLIATVSNYSTVSQAYQRMEKAMDSGAHFITSDYPTPASAQSSGYSLRLPHSVNCNPITTYSTYASFYFQVFCHYDILSSEYYSFAPSITNTIMLVTVIGSLMFILIIFMIYQLCVKHRLYRRKFGEISDDELIGIEKKNFF